MICASWQKCISNGRSPDSPLSLFFLMLHKPLFKIPVTFTAGKTSDGYLLPDKSFQSYESDQDVCTLSEELSNGQIVTHSAMLGDFPSRLKSGS